MVEKETMLYRNLGNSGLKVSAISFGNWLTGKEANTDVQCECFAAAVNSGMNFLDTAEIYGYGQAESVLGEALKRGGWDRDDLVISTKFLKSQDRLFRTGLGRKRLIQAMRNSLKRMDLDYVDIAFLHRFDQEVPLKETLWTINHFIEKGKTSYWGTSMFTAQNLMEVYKICDKYGYPYPIAEQCHYNMLMREKMEVEYAQLFDRFGLGTTIWSPMLGGVLTGKYNDGNFPEGSRIADPTLPAALKSAYEKRFDDENRAKTLGMLQGLGQIAADLGVTQANLALAWTVKSNDVSTALTGASRPEQVVENAKAIEVLDKLTPEVLQKIEDLIQSRPDPGLNWRTWTPMPARR